MKYQYIQNCGSYFGYGSINNNIVTDSFAWDEYEEFDLDNLDKKANDCLNAHLNNHNQYLFTGKTSSYPLSFRDKHFGLWKSYSLKYGMEFTNQSEEQVNLHSYTLFYGICEISTNEFVSALKLLNKTIRESFIVSSNYIMTLPEYKRSFTFTDKSYELNMANIINCCCSRGDKVITLINGCDGITINAFYCS